MIYRDRLKFIFGETAQAHQDFSAMLRDNEPVIRALMIEVKDTEPFELVSYARRMGITIRRRGYPVPAYCSESGTVESCLLGAATMAVLEKHMVPTAFAICVTRVARCMVIRFTDFTTPEAPWFHGAIETYDRHGMLFRDEAEKTPPMVYARYIGVPKLEKEFTVDQQEVLSSQPLELVRSQYLKGAEWVSRVETYLAEEAK